MLTVGHTALNYENVTNLLLVLKFGWIRLEICREFRKTIKLNVFIL